MDNLLPLKIFITVIGMLAMLLLIATFALLVYSDSKQQDSRIMKWVYLAVVLLIACTACLMMLD